MELDVSLGLENHLQVNLFILNFAIIFLSMYNVKASIGNSYLVLLRSLILTIFITENNRSVIAV
jgi:hypothetical protein